MGYNKSVIKLEVDYSYILYKIDKNKRVAMATTNNRNLRYNSINKRQNMRRQL